MPQEEESIIHITPDAETLSSLETSIICEEKGCQRVLPHSSGLRMHMLQCHKQTNFKKSRNKDGYQNWYHCPVQSCIYHESNNSKGKHFSKAKYVKQHYLKIHAIHKYFCSKCSKGFSTQSFLNVHLNSCGLDITCSTCKQKFSCIESLQVHLKRFQDHFSTLLENILREKKTSKKTRILNLKIHKSPTRKTCIKSLLPKPEPTYVIAAIALSEMALAGIKRNATSDASTQTDVPHSKRAYRKSSNPSHSSDTRSRKPKQTTEMETQTQLTHLKKKIRRRMRSGNTSTTPSCASIGKQPSTMNAGISTCYAEDNNLTNTVFNYQRDKCYSKVLTLSDEIYLQEPFLYSSGTQTSPRASFGPLSPKKYHLNLIKKGQNFETKNVLCGSMDYASENFCSGSSQSQTQTDNSDLFGFIKNDPSVHHCGSGMDVTNQILMQESQHYSEPKNMDQNSYHSCFKDETMDVEEIEDQRGLLSQTERSSNFRRPYLGQIRSSSIETQTEHDVFLSTPANAEEEEDIFSSAPLHPDRDGLPDDSSSLWCSIETQTCEAFSDIERYLYSTIHTQTQENETELFPELNFTDTQTQTNLEDSPSYVTTHTQTPSFA